MRRSWGESKPGKYDLLILLLLLLLIIIIIIIIIIIVIITIFKKSFHSVYFVIYT